MRGLFVSFEGVDGCGKTRQMQFASEYLKENGFDPVLTREPGGCRIAEEIRSILLDPKNAEMSPYTEALLFAAARSQHVDEVIRPAVEAGRIVMTDRFLDSSVAYQGFGRRLGADSVMDINRFAVRGMLPDVTIFLDVPPDVGFERMHDRTSYDRIEESGERFFDTLYTGFLSLCDRYPERIIRIDASGSKDETREKVRCVLAAVLEKKGLRSA